jgi:hypothetical protein
MFRTNFAVFEKVNENLIIQEYSCDKLPIVHCIDINQFHKTAVRLSWSDLNFYVCIVTTKFIECDRLCNFVFCGSFSLENSFLLLLKLSLILTPRPPEWHFSHGKMRSEQGCQIFLDTMYQNGVKCTKLPQLYQTALKFIKWS